MELIHNDFVNTISDLGLAQHNPNMDVLEFLPDSKKDVIINSTLDHLKSSKAVYTSINCKGKMYWILSTLSNVFILDSQEANIVRAAELYSKWLKATKNDSGFVPYVSEHFEEVAHVIMGQLTHPFQRCKKNKNDIPAHIEYCFVTIQLFYYLLEVNISNDLIEWLTACAYGMFIPIYTFITELPDNESHLYKEYNYALKRLINLIHYSILKRASVSNNLWKTLCSQSGLWCTSSAVITQWCYTTYAIQDAYISHIMSSKTGPVSVSFLRNCGVEVIIEIPEECLRIMWLSFISL